MKTKLSGILTLLLAFVVQFTFAQERTITGNVTDETGPLPGVSVLIEGTTTGTETDFDGNYSLKAEVGTTIRYSFVGMSTATRTVGANDVIDIIMVSDDNTLDEVVITAFGMKRQKKSAGYASTVVTSKELTEVSATNPLESLSGKIAGVDISSPSQPGASTKVIFRGMSSITGSNNPLYIVDGSPIQDASNSSVGSTNSFDAGTGINDLDPNSIESINFLKGAAATALYGSRGANGVIVITTKRGKDKLKVNVSTSLDFLEVSRVPHIQQQFGTGWAGVSYSNVTGEGSTAQSNENGSWGPVFNGLVRPWSRIVNNQQLIKPYVALEDNVRDFYNLGTSSNASVNINSGSEKGDISFTYSRQDVDGVMPTDQDSFIKHNFGINTGLKINKFSVRVNANYVNKGQKAVSTGQGDDAAFGKGLVQEMLQIPNDLSIVDMQDRSNIFYTPSYFYTPYAANPYSTLENNNINISKDRFFGNIRFSYEFNDDISATFQASTDVDNETIKRWGAIVDYIPGSPQDNASSNGVVGAVSENKYTRTETDYYFNINYNKELNENLKLGAFVGVNYNERTFDRLGVQVTDLDLPNYYELSNSASTPIITQLNSKKIVMGYYGQAELALKDKYFLTLSARNDKSSALPLKNNSYFYYSASLAGVLVDNGTTFAKVRAQYARVGNDTNAYSVFSTAGQVSGINDNDGYFGSITYPFGGQNSYEIYNRIENQNLKPEITDEIEFGLDASLFNRRLTLDVAVYSRETKDLIVNLPVARSTGYSIVTGNFADVTNKGIELALTVKPVVTDDFNWTINYTFTKNKNEVTRVDNESGKISIYSAYNINFYAEVGKPMGAFYAPTPATTASGQIIASANTGYYTYDGNEAFAGSAERDFIMGFQNSFTYKNLKLNVAVDWKQGGKFYSYTKRLSHFVGNGIETTYNGRNSWIIPNSVVADGNGGFVENTTPVAFDDVTAFYNTSQNAAIEGTHILDKTFIRLRSMSLSYSLPNKFLNSTGISSLIFSIYGKNLALWTPAENPYSDPETTSYGRGIRSDFGEFATNPAQRTYGASVKFSF